MYLSVYRLSFIEFFVRHRMPSYGSEGSHFWNVHMHTLHIRNKSRHREQMYARYMFAASPFPFLDIIYRIEKLPSCVVHRALPLPSSAPHMYFSPTRTELTEHIDDIKAGSNDRKAEGILGKINHASHVVEAREVPLECVTREILREINLRD